MKYQLLAPFAIACLANPIAALAVEITWAGEYPLTVPSNGGIRSIVIDACNNVEFIGALGLPMTVSHKGEHGRLFKKAVEGRESVQLPDRRVLPIKLLTTCFPRNEDSK
jgi:hypothetical protein